MEFNPTEEELRHLLNQYNSPQRVAATVNVPLSSVLRAMTRFGIPVYLSGDNGAVRRVILEMRTENPQISVSKISQETGLKKSRLYAVLRDMRPLAVPAHVSISHFGGFVAPVKYGAAGRQQLIELWQEMGHPIPIANRLGLTVSSVCGRLRYIGIDVRMRYDRKLKVYNIELNDPIQPKAQSSGPQTYIQSDWDEKHKHTTYLFL